jgi:tetratricopeptide (TPR) repeat protein
MMAENASMHKILFSLSRLCFIVLLAGAGCVASHAQDRFNFTYTGSGISAAGSLQSALLGQPPAEAELLTALANERRGSLRRAETEYRDAVQYSHYAPDVGLDYARFLLRRGKAEKAEKFLTELRERRPDNAEVLTALAEVELGRHEWADAQKTAKDIRQIGDPHGNAYQIEGAALIGQDKIDGAIALFQSAAKTEPSAMQPMELLVSALERAHKAERAVAVLQSALQKNPNNGAAYVLLGSIQRQTGKPEEARQNYELAIEKQPDYVGGYAALAQLDSDEKKYDDALAVIHAGLQRHADSMVLQLAQTAILERAGRYEAAIDEYQDMLRKQPDSMIVANNLASLLTDRRSDKASLERAQKIAAILRDTQVPQFMDTLGWVDYRNGAYNEALPLLTKAAVALPDHVMIRYHLGMAFLATQHLEQAAEQFRAAQALSPDQDLQEKLRQAQKKLSDEALKKPSG